MKDIEKGILDFNSAKVEKHFKYLNKLFESAVGDVIKMRVNSKQEEAEDELNLIRNLNKSLESELFRARREKNELEAKIADIQCRNSELSEKISIIERVGSELALQNDLKEK